MSKIKSGIYKITNPFGMVYIGSSRNIISRIRQYKNPMGNRKISLSIREHGVENHIFEIVELVDVCNLLSREEYWQVFYNSIENGLNTFKNGRKESYKNESKLEKINAKIKPEITDYKITVWGTARISERFSTSDKKLENFNKKSNSPHQKHPRTLWQRGQN